MKIRSVSANNRKHVFEVATSRGILSFPYSKAEPAPASGTLVADVAVDEELGREAFSYKLASGAEGVVHIEQVLEYNRDPTYMRDLIVYQLTLEARKCLASSPLSNREIIRRLGTSPAQFYRLIDPNDYRKSIDKLLALLHVLDCEVDLVVSTKHGDSSAPHSTGTR